MKPQAVAALTGCLFGLVGATVELWPPQDAIGPALEGIVDLVCWPAYALLEFYGRFFHGNVEAAMPLVVPVVYLYWSVLWVVVRTDSLVHDPKNAYARETWTWFPRIRDLGEETGRRIYVGRRGKLVRPLTAVPFDCHS